MPSPSPFIRPATTGDLPAIVAMRTRLNDLERSGCSHAAIQRLSLDEFTALWGATFDSPTHCWRIVEAAAQPIGFGLIYLQSPRTTPPGAFLHWAFVEESHRRSGIGQHLLEHLLAWARGQGANRVELQFIDGNQAAEAFWGKMGFRPYARKCVHYLPPG